MATNIEKTNPDKDATAADFTKAVMTRLNDAGWEMGLSNTREIINTVTATAHDFLGEGEPVTIAGLVKITPTYKPAQKVAKRPETTGVFFGVERTVAAKPAHTVPASVALKARFLKGTRDSLPTGAKLKKIFG